MKAEGSGSFGTRIYLFALAVTLALSPALRAQPAAQEDSPAELNRRIVELYGEGKFKEAIPLAEKLVAVTKHAKGAEDPDTAGSLNNLAALYWAMRDYAKAAPLIKEALEIRQKVLGQENADTVESMNNLARVYQAMGDYVKAEPLYREALEVRQKVSGRGHSDTAMSLNDLGELYCSMREYAKAELLLKEALEIRQKVLGREHSDTAESLNNLAELYEAMGHYAKAEPFYKKALEIRQKVLGPQHPDTATSLNNLALLYKTMGDFAKAEPLYKEALEIRQKVLGLQHLDTATSLNNLGELYSSMGEDAKAGPLIKEALEIYQQVLGPQHPNTAAILNNLAGFYWATGDYAKAEPLLKEALEIRQKVLGLQHPGTATSLENLGQLCQAMGDYAKAEPLFKEALEIRQKVLGPQHSDTATSLSNLASLYQAMGDYAKAEVQYREALEIRQKALGREHPDTASSLSGLGLLYDHMGEYAKAEPFYKEALEIRQKVLGREHPDTAESLNNLASLYQAMGDHAKAERLYEEALQICQKVLGREHRLTANSLNNLAELYRSMGDYTRAEPLLKEALEIFQKVLGREHPDTATSLDNLAELYHAMGDYAKAEPLYKEALEVRRKVFGKEHPKMAISLNNLGELYRSMGEDAKAEPLLQETLEICQTVLGPEHPDTATSLDNLAVLKLDLGEMQEAKRLGQLGCAAALKMFSQILSFGSEDQRLAYQGLSNPYTLFAGLEDADALLAGAVLHYKGVVLDSIIEDRLLAETSKEEANRDLVQQLKVKKRTLARLLLQTTGATPKEVTERIRTLEQEVEDIEGNLAHQGTDLGQVRRALSITLEQVQAALPTDTVLIEYVTYFHRLRKTKFELRYGAVVLSADAPPRWITLGGAKEIEATLKRYQALVRNPGDEQEIAAVLQKVDDEVWKPVEQAFPAGANRVILSPDGQLNFLSFATLLDPEKGFIAEKYLIQYVTSGRDLLREPQPALSRQVIVMANPKFDRDIQLAGIDPPSVGSGVLRGAEKRDVEDLSFEELAGTQKECEELLPKFGQWGWQTESRTGAEVTKRALMNLHSPYILHLATHGFFEPEDPASETKPDEFQSPQSKSGPTNSRFFKNPMHCSGLALAGANTTIAAWKRGDAPSIEEDGILTAEDVSTLDLKGTWLVTLSACNTGSGEARAGEGVMGLRRGFVEAGAQNLLMTLWPISDEFTVQIMNDFYEAAHQSGNASEALAKTQRDWLVKLRKEKGLASAVNLAGPFIMSSQGKP